MSMVTVKLACLAVVSVTVTLIIIIILQVRESASNRRSQVSPRLFALVANCVNALNAYLRVEESLCLWNLSHDAQKHVRFVIVPW